MRQFLMLIALALALHIGVACRKKAPPGTEDLRTLLVQTNTKLREVTPLLDERANTDSIRKGALQLEKTLKEQYAAAQFLLGKYPNVMADRPQFEANLSTELTALRESLGLLIRRIKYWQKRMPKDQIFNDAIARTAKMSTGVEMQTRPANE